MAKPLSIGKMLSSSSGGFAEVLNRAKQLRKLTIQLQKMVDAPLSDHLFVANIRDNVLIIGTDSAVWHTRVKYLAPMILEQMKQINGLEKLQQIEFRVQPTNSYLMQSQQTKKQTSEKNHNGDLKQALQRLKEKSPH